MDLDRFPRELGAFPTRNRIDRIIKGTIMTRSAVADGQIELLRKVVNYIDRDRELLVNMAAVIGLSEPEWLHLKEVLNSDA